MTHGLTIIESAAGARAVAVASLAVIGLVATAPNAQAEVKSRLLTGVLATNNAQTFTSKLAGAAGNDISLKLVNPGGNNAVLAVAVDGKAITVNLATSAGGALTTTATQLAAAIAGNAAANALVGVANTGASTGAGVVAPIAATLLSGGVDEAFPLDTAVLVTDVDAAAGLAGVGGTLAASLEAIGDQASPIIVVVRVAEGEDAAETDANVIGSTNGNVYTGLQALLAAEGRIGVRPRILGAPGLDTQAVTAEMVIAAKKLRAMVYARAIGNSVSDVILYRDEFSARELMLIWPDTKDGSGAAFSGDAVARALGLRARIDEEQGWHKTLSNVAMDGVTGLTKDIHFDLLDPSTEAGLLNDAPVTTIIRNNGYRFWGNRTTAGSDHPEFSFESAVRTSHALQDMLADIVAPFLDQPMTIGLIKDLIETANAAGRQIVIEGRAVGVEFFFDATASSAQQLAAGRPTFRLQYTPCAPLENPTIRLVITDYYYSGFADQLV